MVPNWAILCPGPSLASVTDPVFDNGGLVAVNSAILRFDLKTPDYWAMLDPEVFKSVFDFDSPRLALAAGETIIWTHWNFGSCAEKTAGWKEPHRDCYRSFLNFNYGDLPARVDLGVNRLWKSYTLFSAIALAVLKGAKNIRVYGADMSGAGYFLEGFENSRTNHSEKRWAEEAFFFRQAQTACALHGIRLSLECS